MKYEQQARRELQSWQKTMQRRPTLLGAASRRLQQRINRAIPERVHQLLTTAIRQMVQGMLFGSRHLGKAKPVSGTLQQVEEAVAKRIHAAKHAAAAEGGITGAGGILAGFADFPLLLGIKLKLLTDIAAQYGYDPDDYRERLYLLHIFQLAFSSQRHRHTVYLRVRDWKTVAEQLPGSVGAFDWRSFQQEYRDHIDLAKLAQLIPGVGAFVGFVVNYRLLEKLGHTAMNAYRMRWLEDGKFQEPG